MQLQGILSIVYHLNIPLPAYAILPLPHPHSLPSAAANIKGNQSIMRAASNAKCKEWFSMVY
jgi:hypothetical protein